MVVSIDFTWALKVTSKVTCLNPTLSPISWSQQSIGVAFLTKKVNFFIVRFSRKYPTTYEPQTDRNCYVVRVYRQTLESTTRYVRVDGSHGSCRLLMTLLLVKWLRICLLVTAGIHFWWENDHHHHSTWLLSTVFETTNVVDLIHHRERQASY